MRPVSLVSLLALSLLAAPTAMLTLEGCSMQAPDEGGLRIVTPEADARLGARAVRVAGVVERDGVREVQVQGETVPVVAGEFQTTVVLPEGPGRIEVRAEGNLFDAVDVFVDIDGPTVHIESPIAGSFIEGDAIHVTGYIEDDSGSVQARANGDAMALDADNRFDFTLRVNPGAHRVRIVAEDAVGHLSSAFTTAIVGSFAPSHDAVRDAIGMGLGDAALDALGEGAAREITEERIAGILMAMNPVMDGWWGELHVTGEAHRDVAIQIAPGRDTLTVTGTIGGLRLPVEARIVGGITIRGTVSVETARIGGEAHVSTENGMPVISLEGAIVELDGLLIDITGLSDWVDRNLVTAALRGVIVNGIRSAIESGVPSALETALAGLAEGHEIDVQGHRARVFGRLADLRASELGLRATLDLGVEAVDGMDARGASALGPITFGAAMPPSRPYTGVDGSVSVDFVNAALFAAWSSGGLSYEMEQLTAPGGTLVDVALVSLLIPAPDVARDTLVGVSVEAALPPIVRPVGDALEIEIADLRVDVIARDGSDTLIARLSIGAHGQLRPFLDGGALAFDIADVEVTVDELTGARGLPAPEELDQIIGDLLRPMLADFAAIRGLEIPAFHGFMLTPEDLGVREGRVDFRAALDLVR